MAMAEVRGDHVAPDALRRRCPVCGTQTGLDGCPHGHTVAARRTSASATLPRDAQRSNQTGSGTTAFPGEHKDLLQVVGYLVAAGGFVVTLLSGWWIAVGFVGVWVGYGCGESATSARRWRDGFVVGVTLTLLGVTLGDSVLARHQSVVVPDRLQPFLEVTIQSSRHQAGELVIRGTIGNVGTASALSPSIELTVREIATGRLVAAETAYADRTPEADLAPGGEASFMFQALVPDDPRTIEWKVAVEDYPGRVSGAGVDRQ